MPTAQTRLFEDSFETAQAANPIFCHQDFLEKLAAHRNQAVGKRASLLVQRLAVDERRQHYKSARGVNQGWRRSRLGGHHGNQFYAWWAPRGAAPLRQGEGFAGAPEGAIFLRDIRHHDDHSPAHPQSLEDHYLPISVPEMRREEYGPAPWTPPQARFAVSRHLIRVLKGHPGTGKTTALLNAADACQAPGVLYVTYSRDLAELARRFFDRYCSGARRFHVVTYRHLLRQLLRADVPEADEAALRRRFRGDLAPLSRSLGAWMNREAALYDEMHAHLVGAALPVKLGRFAACKQARVPEANYRQRRTRYLGDLAAGAVLDLATRLERADPQPLADRFFPELALAWRAAAVLTQPDPLKAGAAPEFLKFDCIVVDECQDLTPLEAFVLVELVAAIGRKRGIQVPVFLAGDEAQTVRPTDFEWGWMNDLLHYRIGTPAEYQLTTNLRSPRTIAHLVNRVWDLYAEISKRDRPSGTGYAEIEDDATDEVLYCTATAGEELNRLLEYLAAREGMAIVSLDGSVPEAVPAAVRPAVLTTSEIKGLDFHSVCLLNPGRHLEGIQALEGAYRFGAADIESIRRRLAIDQLRVALSRPAERLIWLDINPAAKTVSNALEFLNRGSVAAPVPQVIPAAVLQALEEEALDLEERIQRCQQDARQYLAVRPDIAWSRAQQAVSLLGEFSNAAAVTDPAVRQAASLTLAEVCFSLAFRKLRLGPELGNPNLFEEAARAAVSAGKVGASLIIRHLATVLLARAEDRLAALGVLADTVGHHPEDLEPWLLVEIGGKMMSWVDELENAVGVGGNAPLLAGVLPPFYEALRLPDREQRTERLRRRSIQWLMRNKQYPQALGILATLPERNRELEGACLQAMGEYRQAAEAFRAAGNLKEALVCCRSIPDFEAAYALIAEAGDHPAAASYQWLARLRALVAERPEKFNRVMLPPEKKLLEELLEQALGVQRKKPAPRKTGAPRTPGSAPKGRPAAPRRRPT